MICHFSDNVCHKSLKSLHPYIDPSHYGGTSWFDIGFTTSLIVYNLTSQLSTVPSHHYEKVLLKKNLTIIVPLPVTDPSLYPSLYQ